MDRVALSHPLIFFVRGPVNVAHMMVGKKDATLFRRAMGSLALLEPALDQGGLHRASSPHISPSIKRIAQNVGDQALGRNLPDQTRAPDGVGGQLHLVIPKPLKRLAHAPELAKLAKDQPDGFAHSPIWVQYDLARSV